MDIVIDDNMSMDRMVQSSPFLLLSLPAEVRLRIFESFFAPCRVRVRFTEFDRDNASYGLEDTDEDEDYDDETRAYCREYLAITRVSKLVRHESMTAFLHSATFDFQLLDYHPSWSPDDHLRSYIQRMKHVSGPPRLLHYLGIIKEPWDRLGQHDPRWVEGFKAKHVICDMSHDQFDIEDAVTKKDSYEAKHFDGLKTILASAEGDKITLCMDVQDAPLGISSFSGWNDSYERTGIQVYKRRVIVRRKPQFESGKLRVIHILNLLGLDLQEKDRKIVELKQPNQNNDVAGPANTVFATLPANGNVPTVMSTVQTSTATPNTNTNVVDPNGAHTAPGPIVSQPIRRKIAELTEKDPFEEEARQWWKGPEDPTLYG